MASATFIRESTIAARQYRRPSFGKVVPLAREVGVTAGAIDLLYGSPTGNLAVVETKLWRNPEAHRTVLAQILDYAKDLSRISYSDFRGKIERTASRHGGGKDLLQIVSSGSSGTFDGIVFEENLRRVLRTGAFEMFIVGDRIRPEVALLSEILATAANLEFSLYLVEVGFYRLSANENWPLLAIPTVVGRTHEVTRGVVKIRYEGKTVPEVEVTTTENDVGPRSRVDLATFLTALPDGLDEVFQPYLERWTASPFIIYWGQVGFSLRYTYGGRPKTIFDAYPTYMSLFLEKWLPEWGNPANAYRAYRDNLAAIPECQRMFSQGKRYIYYDRVRLDDVRQVLEATDQLAESLRVSAATPRSG